MIKGKKGFILNDYIGWILLGVGLLILVSIIFLALYGKLSGIPEWVAQRIRIGGFG